MFGFKIVFWYWWALAAVLLVFEMLLPGEHFGEVAVLAHGMQPVTVRALTPMTLFVVGCQYFIPLVEDIRGLAHDMEAALARQPRLVEMSREERNRAHPRGGARLRASKEALPRYTPASSPTWSAIASEDVSPGDSIPNRLISPSTPWSRGPWIRKSCTATAGGTIFGRIPE